VSGSPIEFEKTCPGIIPCSILASMYRTGLSDLADLAPYRVRAPLDGRHHVGAFDPLGIHLACRGIGGQLYGRAFAMPAVH
jgi:hypothetical protein